ncbi:MAG: enoyl-CoA hydratase/isomerase family protein [Gaiellales bacterium]
MGAYHKRYETCEVTIDGQVATVRIVPPTSLEGATSDLHWDLGEIFSDLRGDTSTRVIVLTGTEDEFYVLPGAEFFDDPTNRRYVADPAGAWKTFMGIVRTHQAMAEIEKPIVGKINGPALGFGSSLVFACDLIVAVDNASIIDIHLGMGEHEGGPGFGVVTGDGGSSLIPLHMSPAKAKEYLMLAKAYTGQELADMNVINAAVSRDELDAYVDDIVQRLLKRSSYALAWTKRTVNRRLADTLNMTLDSSAAYEMVNFLHIDRLHGSDPKTVG